jgi:hypothetical protein
MFEPVGAPYPGTPIVLAILGLMAAAGVRLSIMGRARREGIVRRWDRVGDSLLTFMVVVCIVVIVWSMWTHR